MVRTKTFSPNRSRSHLQSHGAGNADGIVLAIGAALVRWVTQGVGIAGV